MYPLHRLCAAPVDRVVLQILALGALLSLPRHAPPAARAPVSGRVELDPERSPRVMAVLQVPASVAGELRLEAELELIVDSSPRKWRGNVQRLAPFVDPATQTVTALVGLVDADETLRPGLRVSSTAGATR